MKFGFLEGNEYMFEFGNANKNQREAIQATEGPVLIIAGPGTGKTFTLVKRTVYLIVEKKVKPEEIMIATFTEKAAKEIITRISNELISLGINININEMYIGTFHSICLRILKEHLEFTRLKKNYRLLDQFEQQYIIFQNIFRFRAIENYDLIFDKNIGVWKQAGKLAQYISIIQEELIDIKNMKEDTDESIIALANATELYLKILGEENIIDFSGLQIETFNLLKTNTEILASIKDKIKYIMIDEYQDTNFIQEQLVFLLANDNKNICVVGDDDQGLYRFRGATIRNILEFPQKFDDGLCKKVYLTTNYRSDKDIIDFYNHWMTEEVAETFKFKWDKYRFKKEIRSGLSDKSSSSSVIKVSGKDFDDEWCKEVLRFIKRLKNKNIISNYNQIAFLFRSVKGKRVTNLANYLEQNGINVYSPRSDMFFQRREIRFAIIALMLTFPNYVEKLNSSGFSFMSEELEKYYEESVEALMTYINNSKNKGLLEWIKRRALNHSVWRENANYGLSGLMYQLFEFEPFKSWLSIDLNSGVVDTRPAHNLAMLSNIIVRYEYLHRLDVLTKENVEKHTERFFNMYLRFLFDGGINEFEDDTEYAPSGCVSFLTIHQSKGMEFPIVFIGSLNAVPRKDNDKLINILQKKYYNRPVFEPITHIKFYDFWRLYYTAFSRAQNLLVLTCREKSSGNGQEPSKYFRDLYKKVPYYKDVSLEDYKFNSVKSVNIKESYSFTSHILLYENCSLQYKFYKELGFTPVRVGATIFGTLVHQTIEDIHRAALRGEYNSINTENISEWFNNNYISIVKKERAYLAEPQKEAALKQVLRYADKQSGRWDSIKEAEVEVSLVKDDYILNGTVDLIKGNGNTVEIVDFKSEKKPDLEKEREKIEQYRRQLEVYAHIVQERTGYEVSKLHLYYTGEVNGVPTISFDKQKYSIDNTIKKFEKTVCKIKSKEFNEKSKSNNLCLNCDMRFYCK